ncbi:MAG: HAMP domain-containing sensor histidine kinase [Acidimicrobiia bacterium]
MSLRWRFAIILAVVVAGVVAALASAAWFSAEHELVASVDDALRRQADDAAHGFFDRRSSTGDEQRRQGPDPLQLLDSTGAIVAGVGVELPVDAVDRAVANGAVESTLRDTTVAGTDYRILTESAPFGAVQVARNRSEIDDTLDGLRNRLLGLGLLGTAAAALVGWWLAGRFTRPIEQLTATTERIARTSELAEPITVVRNDEVGRLATSFNAMLETLAGSRRQQHQLVMDASHELRTPLTTLRTNIELLARTRDLDVAEQQQLLQAAKFELEELSALVTELVDLATERRADDQDRDDVDLGDLAEGAVERARRRYGRPIELTEDAPAVVRGAPTLLERAISNLLDNAAKFSPRDAPLEVTVRGSEITVRDHGPGVAEGERERVFDRFYRADDARTMPGSGLGLAIVRQVITEHGGTVTIEAAPGGGALVRVTLPFPPPTDAGHAELDD